LRDYFDAVVGGIPLFGKSGQLTKLTKRLDIAAGQAVYVGDSTSDVDACRRDDIDVIGVTWGYDTRAILEEHEPSFLADAPEDILTIVRDLDCNEA
jgi:phosphoglycolate phosphatase